MDQILRDLQTILDAVPEAKTESFVEAIRSAPRVFVYGLGRSGLVARMFGMRLVHLGREATIVGDTTTPAIREGDLLVLCTRTGRSPILHHAVALGHSEGAKVASIVGDAGNPVESQSDFVVRIPVEKARGNPPQPMGSLYEQALLLYLDEIVLRLMRALGKTVEDMEQVHSNLPG